MHANLQTTELQPAPFCAKPDIVRRFLAWAQTADADMRAQGASALARAYLYSDLPASVRAEAGGTMHLATGLEFRAAPPNTWIGQSRLGCGTTPCAASKRPRASDPYPILRVLRGRRG